MAVLLLRLKMEKRGWFVGLGRPGSWPIYKDTLACHVDVLVSPMSPKRARRNACTIVGSIGSRRKEQPAMPRIMLFRKRLGDGSTLEYDLVPNHELSIQTNLQMFLIIPTGLDKSICKEIGRSYDDFFVPRLC